MRALLGSPSEAGAPWDQPAPGFTGQFVTHEVAWELVSQSRASVGGRQVPGQSGGLGAAKRGEERRAAPALTVRGLAPGREERRAHHASGSGWGGRYYNSLFNKWCWDHQIATSKI